MPDTTEPLSVTPVDAAPEVVVPTPVAPPKKITTEERLEVENIFLRMQNLQLQMQAIESSKNQVMAELRSLQTTMETRRAELSAKYGVDISRTTVMPDGTLVPQS